MAKAFSWRIESGFNGCMMQSVYQYLQRSDPRSGATVRAALIAITGCDTPRLISLALLLLGLAATTSPAQQAALPDFRVVVAAVQSSLAADPDFQPADLVTQSQIEGALDSVKVAGWEVPQPERIVELALADDSFLATELATPTGRKFMRKIARHPGAYARLDRLSTISRGKTLVRDLIRQRDGDKFIEYLATTQGGHQLGGMMRETRRGVDLNKPTGRIYTVQDLVSVLQRLYEKSRKLQ
jgi:hypothetical protein